jgi:hypothetical protein
MKCKYWLFAAGKANPLATVQHTRQFTATCSWHLIMSVPYELYKMVMVATYKDVTTNGLILFTVPLTATGNKSCTQLNAAALHCVGDCMQAGPW